MFKKISVLVPTRMRVAQLRAMLESYHATVQTPESSELVFRIDEDDLASLELLNQTRWTVVTGPRLQGYRSLPAFFDEMRKVASGDVLMCGNDDMVFRTPGWPEIVLAEANKYPDGLFNFGCATLNAGHFPFSIISKHVADLMGYIHDGRLIWGDLFLRDVLAAFGRAIPLPEVQIDHQWMGHTPDQVFLDAHQNDSQNWDEAYWARHREIVAAAVQRIDADHRAGVV